MFLSRIFPLSETKFRVEEFEAFFFVLFIFTYVNFYPSLKPNSKSKMFDVICHRRWIQPGGQGRGFGTVLGLYWPILPRSPALGPMGLF